MKRWEADAGPLLRAVRNFLLFGPGMARGFLNAQPTEAEALREVRAELLPLIRSGLQIRDELSAEASSGGPAPSAAAQYVFRLDRLSAALLPVLQRISVINQRIVEEWWRRPDQYGDSGNVRLATLLPDTAGTVHDWIKAVQDQSGNLAESLTTFLDPASVRERIVDIIAAAQRCFPYARWTSDPKGLSLEALCRRPDLDLILTGIKHSLDASLLEAASHAVTDLFAAARDDERFTERFEEHVERCFDLLVLRPEIEADLSAHDTVTLSILCRPATRDACAPGLEKTLVEVQPIARANDFELSQTSRESPPALVLHLRAHAALAIPSESAALEHAPITTSVRRPQTDRLEFPIKIHRVSAPPIFLTVQSQRTPFLTAQAFLSFRDSLEAISRFVSSSTRIWHALSCEAQCSITLNETAFEQGFFQCGLRSPSLHTASPSEGPIEEECGFPWEAQPKSPLEFFDRWQSPAAPVADKIVLPANAFSAPEIQELLLNLERRFRVLNLELGNRSDLAALYFPGERPEVLKLFLQELAECFSTTPGAPINGDRLTCRAVSSGSPDACDDYALFQVEIHDQRELLVQCGAFSPTALRLCLRPHEYALERAALLRFQRALEMCTPEKPLAACASAAGLDVAASARERLEREVSAYFRGRPEADPIAAMVTVCRDPWNTLELHEGRLAVVDCGHPPKPCTTICYGVKNFLGVEQPISVFRRALMLYDIEQQGRNNGYTFEPSQAFLERCERQEALPLALE